MRNMDLKISIDIPSGLQADSGQPLPCAIKADYTFTALGLKAGLFTGQGKEYCRCCRGDSCLTDSMMRLKQSHTFRL